MSMTVSSSTAKTMPPSANGGTPSTVHVQRPGAIFSSTIESPNVKIEDKMPGDSSIWYGIKSAFVNFWNWICSIFRWCSSKDIAGDPVEIINTFKGFCEQNKLLNPDRIVLFMRVTGRDGHVRKFIDSDLAPGGEGAPIEQMRKYVENSLIAKIELGYAEIRKEANGLFTMKVVSDIHGSKKDNHSNRTHPSLNMKGAQLAYAHMPSDSPTLESLNL